MSDLDPVTFLRATPPFDRVPRAAFDRLAAALEIRFFPAGARIVQHGGAPLEHVLVLRKGAVRLERDGQVLQVLEEGDPVGLTSLLTRSTPLDAVAEDDVLAYALPRAALEPLLALPEFAEHFASGLAERLRASLERPAASLPADLAAPVASLLRRALVRVSPDATVGEASRLMRAEAVSALIVEGEVPGIVTDRDLRNRVLAEGLGPDVRVGAIMTAPVRVAPAEMPVYEAWQVLLEARVHHLPVSRDGALVGLVTSTDLLRTGGQGPVAVLRSVERMGDASALAGYGARLADLAGGLMAGGLDPMIIAGLVSRVNDALVSRVLRWAEDALGPAPCAYAWLVVGSEGRREQTLQTDQDNALVWADDHPEAADYFARLAERAVSDLEAAGFPRCPGDTMATRWRGSLTDWRRHFRGWLDDPTPDALLAAATFFDLRRVHGGLDIGPLEALIAEAKQHPLFLRCLAKAALEHRPRAPLFLRLRGDGSRVHLKREGLGPIVMLARCHALEVGATDRGTLARLAAAERAGLLDAETRATMAEAFGFLMRLRLREQLRRTAPGARPDNEIALAQLTTPERRALKDALRAIREWQDVAAYHYQVNRV